MKPENQFIRGVHKYLPNDVYRMKNHNAYIGGIADVWYSGCKSDLWVEYKYVPVTRPTAAVVPNLSAQQLIWVSNRRAEGRHVWIIVGCKPGGVIFKTLKHIEYGMSPKAFHNRIKTRKELAEELYKFCHTESKNETTEYTP